MALLDRLRRAPSPRFAPSKGIDSGDDREKLASAGWSYHGGVPTRLFNGEKAPGALSYPSLVGVDFYTLRQRSREAAWESPQGGAMLSTLKDNVVNSGAMLVASPLWDLLGDAAPSAPEAREALRREIELRFHLWANSTDGDITGEHTVYQLMGLEYNTRNEDGETVIVMRYSKDPTLLSPLQLQFLDPDQLITSQPAGADGSCILEGVELTKLGAPVAIHVTGLDGKIVRIPYYGDYGRRFILHPKHITRPGQHRGVPFLAPIVHELQKLTDYSLNELEASVVNAAIAAVTLTEQGAKPSRMTLSGGVQGRNTATPAAAASADDVRHYDIRSAGLHLFPGAGNKVESFDTKRPNVNFGQFQDAFLGILSASKGIPIEVLKKSFNANYSASRASLCLFWNLVESERQDSAALFWTPIYEAWFREEFRAGRINAPGFGTSPLVTRAWLNCDWAGIRMPSIDPLKEANAAHQRIADCLTTHDREAKQYNGSDFGDNAARLTEENALLQEAGQPEASAPAANPTDPNDTTDDQPAKEPQK